MRRKLELISALRKRKRMTMEQIEALYGNLDFAVSRRTIRRDIEELGTTYNVWIEYDKLQKAYEIRSDSDEVVELLEQLLVGEFGLKMMDFWQQNPDSIQDYVQFEKGKFPGKRWLVPLLQAVSERREVIIEHRAFYRENSKLHRVEPHYLKEYDGRWYLITYHLEDEKVKAYGLGRILDVQITDKVYDSSRLEEVRQVFRNQIGIWGYQDKPEVVRVWFDHEAAPYVKSKPFHHSQKVITEDEEGAVFEWYVTINFELKRLLYSWLGQFKVVEPDKLRLDIMKKLNKTLKTND